MLWDDDAERVTRKGMRDSGHGVGGPILTVNRRRSALHSQLPNKRPIAGRGNIPSFMMAHFRKRRCKVLAPVNTY